MGHTARIGKIKIEGRAQVAAHLATLSQQVGRGTVTAPGGRQLVIGDRCRATVEAERDDDDRVTVEIELRWSAGAAEDGDDPLDDDIDGYDDWDFEPL